MIDVQNNVSMKITISTCHIFQIYRNHIDDFDHVSF